VYPKSQTMKKRHTSQKSPASTGCKSKAIIRLDTARIAHQYRKKLDKVRHDLEAAQDQWRKFTEEDRPAYERWVHLECGALMVELHRIRQEYDLRSYLLAEARMRSMYSGNSLRDTFQEVQAELNREAAGGDEMPPPDPDAEENSSSRKSQGNNGPEEDDWNDFFSQLAGEKPKREPLFMEKARLRSLYRDLCRRLHPDAGAAMNERTKQLWNEVQEAYANRDLERLESLRALCELEEDGMRKDIPCSRMMDLIKHFQKGLRSVRNLLKNARRNEPGFGFLSWTSAHKALVRQDLQRELHEAIGRLKRELRDLNVVLRELERPLRKHSHRSARASVSSIFDL
jgi:hypothetical protein